MRKLDLKNSRESKHSIKYTAWSKLLGGRRSAWLGNDSCRVCSFPGPAGQANAPVVSQRQQEDFRWDVRDVAEQMRQHTQVLLENIMMAGV